MEDLWEEIAKLIPGGMSIESEDEVAKHADLSRAFRHILPALPALDGFVVTDELMDLDSIFQNRFDAKELGEISCEVGVERQIYKQGETLREYRFRFATQRRALVRDALMTAIRDVDQLLDVLRPADGREVAESVTGERWDQLKARISEIDVLRGTAIKEPPRWSDLRRHAAFGMVGDLRDIIRVDWPAAKPALESALYGPADPIPVRSKDLGALVRAAPAGPVVTALKWDMIDAAAFERLVFNLVSQAKGYSNAQWLMHTNAADRGRDVSVERNLVDPLTGTRVLRVIIQCKHWHGQSIGMSEVVKLVEQMRLWEPPKVDELIIATTGKFAADTVAWIERRNVDRLMPTVTMWPDTHLESLLAERPHLTAEFKLR